MIEIYSQIFDEDKWNSININEIARIAVELVDEHHEIDNNKQISIVFTSNDKVQELNKSYRGKDQATNILSFAFNDDGSDNDMLGEMFIAYGVIDSEAKEQDKNINQHLTHIVIHGILHLLGYDHIENSDAEEMEKLEIEILSKINIENPYKEEYKG